MENLRSIANKTIEHLVNEGADKARCVVISKETPPNIVKKPTAAALFDGRLSVFRFIDVSHQRLFIIFNKSSPEMPGLANSEKVFVPSVQMAPELSSPSRRVTCTVPTCTVFTF